MPRKPEVIKMYREWYFGPQEAPCPGCQARWKKVNAGGDEQLHHTPECDYDTWITEEDAKNQSYETGQEIGWCPEHGDQLVKKHRVSKGPDPYDIQVLACGHRVIWLGKDREDCQIVGKE